MSNQQAKLIALAFESLSENALDEIVIDLFEARASRINNEGAGAQERFVSNSDPRILDQEDLDEIVCEAQASQASIVNSEGFSGQVAFLIEELGYQFAVSEIRGI